MYTGIFAWAHVCMYNNTNSSKFMHLNVYINIYRSELVVRLVGK